MSDTWACDVCGFELWYPIDAPMLRVSQLGLYNEDRFPGRVLLVLTEHQEHLDKLPGQVLSAFWSDAALVGGILRRVTNALRVNYAVLGNAQPHLHAHLIPRLDTDPLPTRPPWNDPRPPAEMPAADLQSWSKVVSDHLARTQ